MDDTERSGIAWDDNGQPYSLAFGDVYYSKVDGLAESQHVFLEGNALAERWQSLAAAARFSIFESGFGTGLNFLLAWQLWRQLGPPQGELHFTSVEAFPLSHAQLSRALQNWPVLQSLSARLLHEYPPSAWRGLFRLCFEETHQRRVYLNLFIGDINDAVLELGQALPYPESLNAAFGEKPALIDAWFLDGFAPKRNPAMWSPELFRFMANNSRPGTRFATFTAAGAVRRALQAEGFICDKVPGFGRKREMLRGHFDGHKTAAMPGSATPEARNSARWSLKRVRPFAHERPSIAVVGAGLSGCLSARALAERGYQVTVYERGTLACGASGNLQGAVYTRLSLSRDALSEFNRCAQIFADAYYQRTGLYEHCGEACGVLHLINDASAAKHYPAFFTGAGADPRFFAQQTASDSAPDCGLPLERDALLVKRSGWLRPPQLCQTLLKHPAIELREGCAIESLERVDGRWSLRGADTELGRADIVVLCAAHEVRQFAQTAELPAKTIRGQVNHLSDRAGLGTLRKVICGAGYLTPPLTLDGRQVQSLGASFELRNPGTHFSAAETEHNFRYLSDYLNAPPTSSDSLDTRSPGRVGFRCASPDYLPLCGPVPDVHAMRERFAHLQKNAYYRGNEIGAYQPGLYCNYAFGSRGLAYGPLCAELIASLIAGAPLPLRNTLYQHLHPARFVIRALKRNQS